MGGCTRLSGAVSRVLVKTFIGLEVSLTEGF